MIGRIAVILFAMSLLVVPHNVRAGSGDGKRFPDSAQKGLPLSDPRSALIGRALDEIAPPGSTNHQVLSLIREAMRADPKFTLRDLPPDFVREILSSRHKGVDELLTGWGESIKYSSEFMQVTNQEALFQGCIKNAEQKRLVSPRQAMELRRKTGLSNPLEGSPGINHQTRVSGTWKWKANCPSGKFKGTYQGGWIISEQDDLGNIAGTFTDPAHPGSLEGEINGSQVIIRRAWENRKQEWRGTLTGKRISGSLSDTVHPPCSFEATAE